MRTGTSGGIVFPMDPERTRLTVELESRTEPIHGQILDPDGQAHEFSGYMGLIETLERLRPQVEPGLPVATGLGDEKGGKS